MKAKKYLKRTKNGDMFFVAILEGRSICVVNFENSKGINVEYLPESVYYDLNYEACSESEFLKNYNEVLDFFDFKEKSKNN